MTPIAKPTGKSNTSPDQDGTELSNHPAANLFPLLDEAELFTLGNDIKARGLISPIAIQVEKGRPILLDGRNRIKAMERVGWQVSIVETSAGGWRLVATENGKEVGLNRRLGATVTVVSSNPVESSPASTSIADTLRSRPSAS
jgi:hypothetical protein